MQSEQKDCSKSNLPSLGSMIWTWSLLSWILFKTTISNIPNTGVNGADETNIAHSKSLSLDYLDADNFNQKMIVSNLDTNNLIYLIIERNDPKTTLPDINYEYVNSSKLNAEYAGNQSKASSNPNDYSGLLSNGFFLSGKPVSIHLNFKPSVSSPPVGYLLLFKFGSSPKYNSTYRSFDSWSIKCPSSEYFKTSNI